jgi:hypothetical protein
LAGNGFLPACRAHLAVSALESVRHNCSKTAHVFKVLQAAINSIIALEIFGHQA